MNRSLFLSLLCCSGLASAAANVAPTAVVKSAIMRPGTTLMDVVYRVTDPDDATVRVRALAFIDGARSFAKVLRPTTLVEGTDTELGDAMAVDVDHTLSWDVAADWNIDLGQVKFEILCRDTRGLLAFDWLTIPAAGGKTALTISRNAPSDDAILDALFWQYADGDPALTLASGVLSGNANSGVFNGVQLASGGGVLLYGCPYVFKKMNLDPASYSEANYAGAARSGLDSPERWHAANRPYAGMSVLIGWGIGFPAGLTNVKRIYGHGVIFLALNSDGTVWGGPAELTNVVALAIGGGTNNHNPDEPMTPHMSGFCLALRSNGTIVGWGDNALGRATPPTGLTEITAIAAGNTHGLALKADGTVVGWGSNSNNKRTPPTDLKEVVAVAAGIDCSMAIKNDGSVVAWGNGGWSGSDVAEIAVGSTSEGGLVLKKDNTAVAWGTQSYSPGVPVLTDISRIAAGDHGNGMILKTDGTVRAWGWYDHGQFNIPANLTGITDIVDAEFSVALKGKAP